MGLFGKRTQQREQLDALLGQVNRDLQLGQQVVQKDLAGAGMTMGDVQQAAANAMQPGVMQQMQAYRDRVMRLNAHGVETPATVGSVSLGPASPMLGGVPAQLRLTVQPTAGAPYEVCFEQPVHEMMARTLAAGQHVTVKVDPGDPRCVMLWGGDASAAPPSAVPPDDRIERIARLQDLRVKGILTEEEFQAQKAKLLAD
jgi:hypothetical protein